jgi:hypothetical protein
VTPTYHTVACPACGSTGTWLSVSPQAAYPTAHPTTVDATTSKNPTQAALQLNDSIRLLRDHPPLLHHNRLQLADTCAQHLQRSDPTHPDPRLRPQHP